MSDFLFSDTDQALWLYHYDAAGVFIGNGLTIIPANTGLPANTTTIKCTPDEGQTGVWNGAGWDYVEDKRGSRYWNKYGKGYVVVSITDTVPEDAIFLEPPLKEDGYVLLFQDGFWSKIKDLTGEKYYSNLGVENIIPDPYFIIPDGFTMVPPPSFKAGYATLWTENGWIYVDDNRGKTAYKKDTGTAVIVSDVGPLSDDLTFEQPSTEFDEWDGEKWVTNQDRLKQSQVESAERLKASLRKEADEEIAVFSSAVKYGIATEEEKNALELWEVYRVELTRIDASKAPDIEWPAKP